MIAEMEKVAGGGGDVDKARVSLMMAEFDAFTNKLSIEMRAILAGGGALPIAGAHSSGISKKVFWSGELFHDT